MMLQTIYLGYLQEIESAVKTSRLKKEKNYKCIYSKRFEKKP